MRKRLLAVLCLLGVLGAVCVLSLSGCEGATTIFRNETGPINLDSYVDLPDIQVSVHTAPEVYVNRPFTVVATISSLHPLSSLSGSGENIFNSSSDPSQTERLDEFLRPPASYTGSYALCLIVDLRLDDETVFGNDNLPTPVNTKQEFTVVPDVTTAQTVQWTVIPRDTFGLETLPQEASVPVWFDAETTCRLGNPSLVGEAFYLVSSRPGATSLINVELPAKFTVVNEDLRQQRAITAQLQPLAVAAAAVATTASVGWAAGFFAWARRRLRARRKQSASENVTQRSAVKRLWFFDDVLLFVGPGVALLSLGMGLITLGPSTVAYILGTDATLGSFFGGMVVACVGIVVLARAVRRLRVASSA